MESHGWIEFILSSKDCVPLISLSFDRARLDRAIHLTMELDLDVTNFAEMESLVDDLIATLRIGKRVVAIPAFEARVARLFPMLDPSKKGLHRFIETLQHILLYLAVDVLIFFSHLFDGRKLIGLHAVGNRHTTDPIRLTPLRKRRIVQLFAASQSPFQCCDLFLGGIDTELIRLIPEERVLGFASSFCWGLLFHFRHASGSQYTA